MWMMFAGVELGAAARGYSRAEVRVDLDVVCAELAPRPVKVLKQLVDSFHAAAAQPPPPPSTTTISPPPLSPDEPQGWLAASASWGGAQTALAGLLAVEGTSTNLQQLLPWIMKEKEPRAEKADAKAFDDDDRHLVPSGEGPEEVVTEETEEEAALDELDMTAAVSVDLAASVSELFFDCCAEGAPPPPESAASLLYGSAMFASALSHQSPGLGASVASVDVRALARECRQTDRES